MHNQTYVATVPTKELKLGSGGDQGGGGFYEELMTGRQGAGFVDQFGGAVFEILEGLFHDSHPIYRQNQFIMVLLGVNICIINSFTIKYSFQRCSQRFTA